MLRLQNNEKKYIFTVSSKDGISMKEVIDAVTNLKFAKKLEIRS